MSIEATRACFEASFVEADLYNKQTRDEKSIIDSYLLRQTEDEIWVTEQVNNLLFQKR